MAKPKHRKKKKICKQIDRAGNLSTSHTPKHNRDASRRIMYRNMIFQEASKSLSIEEIEDLKTKLIARQESQEKVKPPKPIMTWVRTKLDDKGVPIEGNTETITISNADKSRLETILTMKRSEKEAVEQKI